MYYQLNEEVNMSKSDHKKRLDMRPAKGPQIPEVNRPSPPIPVRNDELKYAIDKLKKEPSQENNINFLNEVVNAKLLAPISMDKDPEIDSKSGEVVIDKDTEIRFEMISNNQGQVFYPVFTDGTELRKVSGENQQIMLVNFKDLSTMIEAQREQVAGFVINPKGENMIFPTDMVITMKNEMEKEDREKETKQ